MAKRYSAKERKAYHMGRAYETAKQGKRVVCPDEKTKQSFRNGVNSVKNGQGAGTKNSGQSQYNVVFVPGVGTCRINKDGVISKFFNGGVSNNA